MTSEQMEAAIAQTLRLAMRATEMSAGLALSLQQAGLLTPAGAADFAKLMRDVAEMYEAAGHDDLASAFWTSATLVQRNPPSPE